MMSQISDANIQSGLGMFTFYSVLHSFGCIFLINLLYFLSVKFYNLTNVLLLVRSVEVFFVQEYFTSGPK